MSLYFSNIHISDTKIGRWFLWIIYAECIPFWPYLSGILTCCRFHICRFSVAAFSNSSRAQPREGKVARCEGNKLQSERKRKQKKPAQSRLWAQGRTMQVQMRRKATPKEMHQGQEEMRLAQERFEKEANEGGELPLEDVQGDGKVEEVEKVKLEGAPKSLPTKERDEEGKTSPFATTNFPCRHHTRRARVSILSRCSA